MERVQKESFEWKNSLIEIVCASFMILILFVMISRLFLHHSSSAGTKRDIVAEDPLPPPQKNVQRRKSKQSRKKKRKSSPSSGESPKLDDTACVLDDDIDIEGGGGGHAPAKFVLPLAELENSGNLEDDDVDIEGGAGGHSTANIVVSLAEVESSSNTGDDALEEVDVVVVSAEPQVICSNLYDDVSSSWWMGEHASQGKVDAPDPLACSDAEDAEDTLSFQPYPRWVLLAHHVVSLRIAKGPPGLEDATEGTMLATQLWRPPVVKAISSLST